MDNFNQNDSALLARVHDKYLYASDIRSIVPDNISPRDSISIVRSYVNDWVRTNVIIYHAQQNLTSEQLDFSKQLEDYRNSLIIYHYETKLIDQNLDTIVNDVDIETYYNTHLNDFELKENICKVIYVIVENNTVLEDTFDQVFALPDSLLFDSLDYYIPTITTSSYIDSSSWVRFYNIQQIIPIETYNRELFLKNNRFIKIKTEQYIFFCQVYGL